MRRRIPSKRPSSARTSAGRPHQLIPAALEGQSYEWFIQELAASFVRAPVAEIGNEVDRWIKAIVLANDLDRGAVSQIDQASGNLVVRHSWSRGRLVKLPVGMELARPAPWFDQLLMNGRTLVYSSVSELPPEFFTRDWKTFRRYVPKSNISVPLRIGGEVVGSVGFACLRKERSWSPRWIRRFELVAGIFGYALERRHAVEENTILRHELSHVSRTAVMGELSASLAHQLNQPIAAILGNAEAIQSMLESSQPDINELRAAIDDIVRDDLRATEIIKGLRDFFRKGQMLKVSLDLGEVVGDVIRMVRSDALFRNVSLHYQKPSSLPRVEGDRIQIQQAILNLVLNALDAVTEDDGAREVSVSVAAEGGQVLVAVRDSGKGLDPVAISHIFEPFFTTKPQGMGMGLTISNSIVKQHGGKLSAHRNADIGSTFEMLLPALTEQQASGELMK
jgi:signal transduction histidine kinase